MTQEMLFPMEMIRRHFSKVSEEALIIYISRMQLLEKTAENPRSLIVEKVTAESGKS